MARTYSPRMGESPQQKSAKSGNLVKPTPLIAASLIVALGVLAGFALLAREQSYRTCVEQAAAVTPVNTDDRVDYFTSGQAEERERAVAACERWP